MLGIGFCQTKLPVIGRRSNFSPAALAPRLWIEPRRGGLVQPLSGSGAAAVAEDDPVGFLPDLSGNALHLQAQANTAVRPTLKGVGAVPYLNFAAASSQVLLRASALGSYAAGGATWGFAWRGNSAVALARILCEAAGGSDVPGYSLAAVRNAAPTENTMSIINDAATVLAGIEQGLACTGMDNAVHTIIVSDTGSAITAHKDGVQLGTFNYARSGAVTLNRFSLGGRVGTTAGNYWSGRIYAIVVINRVISAQERDLLTLHLAECGGVPGVT